MMSRKNPPDGEFLLLEMNIVYFSVLFIGIVQYIIYMTPVIVVFIARGKIMNTLHA